MTDQECIVAGAAVVVLSYTNTLCRNGTCYKP